MQDYAQAHDYSLKALYLRLFGVPLEHVTPTHDALNRAMQLILMYLRVSANVFAYTYDIDLV